MTRTPRWRRPRMNPRLAPQPTSTLTPPPGQSTAMWTLSFHPLSQCHGSTGFKTHLKKFKSEGCRLKRLLSCRICTQFQKRLGLVEFIWFRCTFEYCSSASGTENRYFIWMILQPSPQYPILACSLWHVWSLLYMYGLVYYIPSLMTAVPLKCKKKFKVDLCIQTSWCSVCPHLWQSHPC